MSIETDPHYETKTGKDLSEYDRREWLTEEDSQLLWEESGVDLGYDIYWINALLTRNLQEGKLPVVAKAKVRERLRFITQKIELHDTKTAIRLLEQCITDLLDEEGGQDDE